MTHHVVIRNGPIVDGTGHEPRHGDIDEIPAIWNRELLLTSRESVGIRSLL
jgi:hypothetical protein